jgi:hypothetical protein
MWMIEARSNPDFGEKSLGANDGAQVGAQYFERYFAVVLDVAREVNGRHSSSADLTLYDISVG